MSALLKIDGLLDALEADESKTSDRYVRLFDGTKVPIVALGVEYKKFLSISTSHQTTLTRTNK